MPKAKYLWHPPSKQSEESPNADPLLILYSSEGCHLCEQAKKILAQQNVKVKEIDIAFDDNLFAIYGTRIPVLRYALDGCALEYALQSNKNENVADNSISSDMANITTNSSILENAKNKQKSELDWPFTQQELQIWLNNNGITYNT